MELSNLTELSPPVALVVALNFFGFYLKKSPLPDWLIPFTLILLGGIAYPFISEVGKVSYTVQNPGVFNFIIGCALGGASVGVNQMVRQFQNRQDPPANP